MLSGFAESKTQIDLETVRDTIQELYIPGENNSLPLPPSVQNNWFTKRLAISITCLLALIIFVVFMSNKNILINEQNIGELFHNIRELLIEKGAIFWERYFKL
jgi:hypothetical protein